MSHLGTQRRLAMSLFGVGFRKVWLDPTKRDVIAKAKTREAIRDLIGQDVIQVIPSHRGKRDHLTKILQHNNKTLQRIKKEYAAKQSAAQQRAGTQATGMNSTVAIDEATAQSL